MNQSQSVTSNGQTGFPREIRSLTGLRGLAACYVMFYHFLQNPLSTGTAQAVLRHGYIAVDLFFVLSGFVMALTYGSTFAVQVDIRKYGEFLWKRLGRIYPLYIVVTASAALLAAAGARPSFLDFVWNALLIQTWGLAPSIGFTTWSISTEFAAYILFPVLTAAMLRARWGVTALWTAVAVGALAFAASRSAIELHQSAISRSGPLDFYAHQTPFPMIRCFAGFMLGMLAYRLSRLAVLSPILEWRYTADVLLALVATLLAGRADILIVVLFIPLVISLSTDRSVLARVLASGVLHWLGLISYSIYLVHRVVGDVLRGSVFDLAIHWRIPHAYTVSGVVLMGVTLVVSAVTYYTIEKPGRNWARRMVDGRSPPIALDPSAP